MTGVKHEHNIGMSLRDNFFNGLVSEKYSPKEVYTQTAFTQRTMDCAIAQLEGLYHKQLKWPSHDESYAFNTIPRPEDFILDITAVNCPRFGQILKAVKDHPNVRKINKQIDDDLERTLFGDLRLLTNMTDASTEEMHNLCSYIYWAKLSGLKLLFELTDEQFDQC